jgi:hypothetical protein
MQFLYTTYKKSPTGSGVKTGTTTRIEELTAADATSPNYIEIWDNINESSMRTLHTAEDLDDFTTMLERRVWRDKPVTVSEPASDVSAKQKIAEAVNPSHYKEYLPELEWLEAMQYRYSGECFVAAVDLQIRKYMDREGKKDAVVQESLKALWYMRFKTAFMKNGYKPIRVKDIEVILRG